MADNSLHNQRKIRGADDPTVFRIPDQKKCPRCGLIKHCSEFGRHKAKTRAGLSVIYLDNLCRLCESLRGIAQHRQNPAAHIARQRKYRIKRPDAVVQTKRKSRAKHRKKTREQEREYRRQNHERVRVWKAASNYKRREAGFSPGITEVRRAIEETLNAYRIGDQYVDVYSGELIDKPSIDHIVPLHQGGDNSADNMCVTSKTNNSSKHRYSLLVWLVKRAQKCHDS